MNAYVRWRKRQFYWALAGLAAYVSFKGLWGAWFTRTLLAATGLDNAFPDSGSLSMPQWAGLLCGTLVVASPAIIGFVAYLVSWVGWPGHPIPRRQNLWAGVGMALGITVASFGLVGMLGNYWPPSQWSEGWRSFAQSADFALTGTEWLGDMYFGLAATTVGLYAVILLCAALLRQDLDAGTGWLKIRQASPSASRVADPVDSAVAPAGPTGIWWPYAAGLVAVVGGILVAIWPHLPH